MECLDPRKFLDDENAEIVLENVRDYVSKGGSVLLVTHNVRATEYTTRTLKMKEGRLLQ